jgi:hypothetical protein
MQHRTKPSWQSVQPSFRYISQPVGGAKRPAAATIATGGVATQDTNALPALATLNKTSNDIKPDSLSHTHSPSPLSCASCLDPSPKRTRSRSWDPNTVLQSKRRVRSLTQAGRGHQRAQTMTVQQRKGREEFRKALVNLIM